MQIERRALYNSLRMHWLLDPSTQIDAWQVEDYRALSLEALFALLSKQGFTIDRAAFVAYADSVESPEDLTDHLSSDSQLDYKDQDKLYLVAFELWRRLVPEKRCLSIFCDELDYQISKYDLGELKNLESLEDALANLDQILRENSDEGIDPVDVFASIKEGCANDIENFLYDFIMDQMDGNNASYAQELFEAFSPYMQDAFRIELMRLRLLVKTEPEEVDSALKRLIKKLNEDTDLDFYFDLLTFLTQDGEKSLFITAAHKTIRMLKTEEDLQDFLTLCRDYYHCLDNEEKEQYLQKILTERASLPRTSSLDPLDSLLTSLKKSIN